MTAPAVYESLLEEFDRDGFVIVRDAIAPQHRAAAAATAHRLLASERRIERDRSADGKDGFRGIVAVDDAFLPLLANPAVLGPVITLLSSTNLHLLSSHLISLPSLPQGARRTIRVPERHGWHRDMAAATADLGTATVPRLAIKCAYFLTDPGPDTGTTMFLPGSHTRTGPIDLPDGAIDPPGAVTPQLGPTEAMLFENRTWHAGGLNTSGAPRLAVMMQYGYRWLAQLDNPHPELRTRGELTAIEHQLLGRPDRHPDGSVAPERTGSRPLAEWWQHRHPALDRCP